jgi:hypothetical protein
MGSSAIGCDVVNFPSASDHVFASSGVQHNSTDAEDPAVLVAAVPKSPSDSALMTTVVHSSSLEHVPIIGAQEKVSAPGCGVITASSSIPASSSSVRCATIVVPSVDLMSDTRSSTDGGGQLHQVTPTPSHSPTKAATDSSNNPASTNLHPPRTRLQ